MDGLPSFFSFLKHALSSLEKAIPPAFGGIPAHGDINKDVTGERRSFTSLIAPTLDRWLGSLSDPHDLQPTSVTLEDDLEKSYGCDNDVRESLKEFHDWFHKLWPAGCETPHKLMLKLTSSRQYEARGHQKLLALDTLASGHDQHWGGIVFTLRKKPSLVAVPQSSSRRVVFADDAADDSDVSTDPEAQTHDHHPAWPHQKASGIPQQGQPDFPTLCSLIERSAQRVCLHVDVESLASSEPRGEKGIRSSKPIITLNDVLTPLKMVGCDHKRRRDVHLTREQKAELGLILACSLLQLCRGGWGNGAKESPWLRRDWAEHGVCFLPGIRNELNFSSPYLPLVLEPGNSDEGEFDYYASSVVALATTLVQLQDDDVVEELDSIFQELIDDGEMTHTTKYCALLELLDMETFTSFVDEKCQAAIRACLTGDFATSICMEEEEVTEKLFHTMVISPLAEYHQRMQQLAVESGYNQKLSATARQDNRQLENGRPSKVGASQQFTEQSVYSVDDETEDMTGEAMFPVQEAAFQAGRHAKPADWLQDLKKVSAAIMKIQNQCVGQPRPVRVAILDTGVDLDRQFFRSGARRSKIKKTADFVSGGRSEGASTDTFGHGSLMAQLLMEVAPMADVYIARVAEDTNSLPRSTEAIAQAIEWADKQGVDIISMSFGFTENDPSITKAIESVHARRTGSVIFIASAGNSLYETEKFPARHPFVIAVYATDSYGTFARSNPPLKGNSGLVFGAYGDNIPSRFSEEYGSTICQPGSSVAAAIAAAIATMMLTYIVSLPFVGLGVLDKAKMEDELKRRREKLVSLQKLRTRDGMSSLFERMAPDKTHQRQRWICPIWFWYDRPTNAERETALLEVANDVRTPVPNLELA